MVGVTDLKWYKSTSSGLGGAIDTGSQIMTATPDNFFTNIPRNELVTGKDYFGCAYLKNTHATENMDNFKLWISKGTRLAKTVIRWGFDPVALEASGYKFSPSFDADGASYDDTASTADLQLNHWAISTWFKTSTTFAGNAAIVNKGGFGSDTAGNNMSYGIWMNTAGNIVAGFEEGTGTDHFISSPLTYNDGLFHFAIAFYSGTTLRLYIDDMTTPVNSASVTATPEVNTKPVRIGANSRATDSYFTGEIDEVRVWNRSMTSETERTGLMAGTVNTTGLVLEKKFGADDNTVTAQTIANKYTAPIGIDWHFPESEPTDPNYGKLKATLYFPIWIWLHVTADSEGTPTVDDNAIFSFTFDIPQGGTGSGGSGGSGGGTGGNPPPTNTDYKIALAGDWGVESVTDDVIQLIKDQGYDLVVGVGDNAYEPASSWISKFNTLKSIMNSEYGNHEYSESGGISPYKTFFGHDKTYFTFKFQNIFFLMIDDNDFEDSSAPSLSVGGTQHNFIKSELARIASDNTITWKIAVMHHPWFGNGAKHPANEGGQVGELHELFQNNKVSFVVTGHNHNWQRSNQVAYNSSDPRDAPTVVDSSSPFDRNAVGLIAVVSGTGGHDSGSSLYSLPDAGTWAGYLNKTHNGVWEIVASNNGQTLTCSFVDTAGSKYDTIVINA